MPRTLAERRNDESDVTTPLGYPAELLGPNETYDSVTDKIGGIVLDHPRQKTWLAAFLPSFGLFAVLLVALSYLLYLGVGIWGINVPVAWGFAIVNFVWWIGSATRAHLFRLFCCCCSKSGAPPSIASLKR